MHANNEVAGDATGARAAEYYDAAWLDGVELPGTGIVGLRLGDQLHPPPSCTRPPGADGGDRLGGHGVGVQALCVGLGGIAGRAMEVAV